MIDGLALFDRFNQPGQRVLRFGDADLHDAMVAIKNGHFKSQHAADFRAKYSAGPRDYAGMYVNLIRSSTMRSLATRWSGGRGPAKNGVPPPSRTGRR